MPLACARGVKVARPANARSFQGEVFRICTVVFQFARAHKVGALTDKQAPGHAG